jgi:acetyltransferase-like isoleucine patch superfamily enzyme
MSQEVGTLGFEAVAPIDVQSATIIGLAYRPGARPVRFRGSATIRSHSVIYADVVVGDRFEMGHGALIREETVIGRQVMIGSHVVIDGNVTIGDFVKIQTGCYIPSHTTIGTRVFMGPHVVLTNDRFPLKARESYRPEGPVIEDGVTLGARCVVLPGVVIGARSFVAAGAVVTRDVPQDALAVGVPGRILPLPAHLRELNRALNWPIEALGSSE